MWISRSEILNLRDFLYFLNTKSLLSSAFCILPEFIQNNRVIGVEEGTELSKPMH